MDDILDGIAKWPREEIDRDALYFLAQSLRGRLVKELPERNEAAGEEQRKLGVEQEMSRGCEEEKEGAARAIR